MRGKGKVRYHRKRTERITPAYAGKSRKPMHRRKPMQDHPRLCGEKFFLAPLVLSVSRITPAYAGKRTAASVIFCQNLDRPRLCGEKTKKIPKQRNFFHQSASFSFSLQYT